jgi:hypothetical protein
MLVGVFYVKLQPFQIFFGKISKNGYLCRLKVQIE